MKSRFLFSDFFGSGALILPEFKELYVPLILNIKYSPFAGRALNWQANKLGLYRTMFSPLARSVVLRRNQTIVVELSGNIFIHIAAIWKLSLQTEPCRNANCECLLSCVDEQHFLCFSCNFLMLLTSFVNVS